MMCTLIPDAVLLGAQEELAQDLHQERIEVVRIRLRQPVLQLAVVIGDFRDADKILVSWARDAKNAINSRNAAKAWKCEFEISFCDGYMLQGSYQVDATGHSSARMPSLSKHVRECLGSMLQGHTPGRAGGSALSPEVFFQRYTLEMR